jgi:ATP-dependent Lhr-like helicase
VDVPTLLHYSSLDREHREMVERRFQQAEKALCIATSTLELGVDIGDIDAVVMYGAPSSISSFVQRIGRGNRRSGTCTVYGLCREYHIDGAQLGAEHDLILLYALVASMLRSELERKPHAEMFSVLAQQFCSLAWQYDSVVREVVERVVREAEQHPFASALDLESILDSLCLAEVFRCDPQAHAYYPAEQWERLKRSLQLWVNIASSPQDTVVDNTEDIPLSEVPRGAAQPGQVLLLAGEPRLVTNVDGWVVRTMRLSVSNPQLISYDTMGAVTPPEVAEMARELLQSPTFPDLPVHADDALCAVLRLYRQRFRNFDFDHCLPYAVVDGRFCYYTFAGTWANEIMAVVLRDHGWAADTDSWRVYTQSPIQHLSLLPTSEEALRQVIHSHIGLFIHRIKFSTHFYNLPEDLQHREVCSLIDLSRVADCFMSLSQKTMKLLSNE